MTDIAKRVPGVVEAAARIVRFLRRQKRVGTALLLTGPLLLTGDVELFVLNALGLGIAALVVRGQVRKRREMKANRRLPQRRAERDEYEHRRWLERREQGEQPKHGMMPHRNRHRHGDGTRDRNQIREQGENE